MGAAWRVSPEEWTALEFEISWMKHHPGIYHAAVEDWVAHPWARRISVQVDASRLAWLGHVYCMPAVGAGWEV